MPTLEERLARAQGPKRFLTMSESGNFSFTDDTTATRMSDSIENILQRVDGMRALYSLEQLNETHTIVMPNGLVVADVPIVYTLQNINDLAAVMLFIQQTFNEFPPCQQLQSSKVH